jgi:hypothetical protein
MKNCKENQTKKLDLIIEKDRIHMCFWTWPWGHCYHPSRIRDEKCCHCPKERSAY